MVTSIARQSVILKCLRQKSVLVGNYEFYYLSGLMKKLYQLDLHEDLKPQEMSGIILQALPGLKPANEQEQYLLRLVSIYEPLEQADDQMRELFRWGEQEPDLWQVSTRHSGSEFVGKEGQ